MKRFFFFFATILLAACSTNKQTVNERQIVNQQSEYQETYRPQFTFAEGYVDERPERNGLPRGVYNLVLSTESFEKSRRDFTLGHATSRDLSLEQQSTALAPDELGLIFRADAVVDANNTSGFGKEGRFPWWLFTQHNVAAGKTRKS